MARSKKKESEEDGREREEEEEVEGNETENKVTQSEVLDRIYAAVSKKLPNQDDKELLQKLVNAMKAGGPEKAEEEVEGMIAQLSGEK